MIGWRKIGSLSLGTQFADDQPRRLEEGEFPATVEGVGFDPSRPERCFDPRFADLDHAPGQLPDPRRDSFGQIEGAREAMAETLAPTVAFVHPFSGQRVTRTVCPARTEAA